jgi:protein-tyrosine phosphatase
MFTKVYWIAKVDDGAALGIMPRPRGNDWLEDEIKQLRLNGVNTIISLLESEEILALGLENERKLCLQYNIDFINYPIQDRGVPNDQRTVNELIVKLKAKIDRGERIVIHCRMGIGRSSIIAAAVLMKGPVKATEIFDTISKRRGLQVPDTEAQIGWLRSFEE